MQELLPFGEYVSPEQTQSAHNLIANQFEAWELLARYAVTGPGLNTGRRRAQPHAEPLNGKLHKAIAGLVHAVCDWLTSQALMMLAVDNSRVNADSSSSRQLDAPPDQAAASNGFTDDATYPSSWPPNSARGKPQAVGPEFMHAKRFLNLQQYPANIHEQPDRASIASKALLVVENPHARYMKPSNLVAIMSALRYVCFRCLGAMCTQPVQ